MSAWVAWAELDRGQGMIEEGAMRSRHTEAVDDMSDLGVALFVKCSQCIS